MENCSFLLQRREEKTKLIKVWNSTEILSALASEILSPDLDEMGTDPAIVLDLMAPPSPTQVSISAQADEAGRVVSLNGNGTAEATFSQETPAPEFGSHSYAPEEEINPPAIEEEQRVSAFSEENVTQENHGPENSNTVAATYAPQEESSDKPSQGLEYEAVVQTQETFGQEDAPALVVGKEDDVPDIMDILKQDEIPANGDEQQQRQELASSQGGELLKQEVAHRSHVLGSLSKLDENSARQLLNDSGWNVSQSVRMNGKTQWYYRSPLPKPVLMGSLTSAVALWKKLVDEDHKKKGGGDDDLYPMVTAFLGNAKRPAAKKRKRGRYAE